MYEFTVTQIDESIKPNGHVEIASGVGSAKTIAASLRALADELDPQPAKAAPSFREVFAKTIADNEARSVVKDRGEQAGQAFMRDVLTGKRKLEDFGAFLLDFAKSELLRSNPDVTEEEVDEAIEESGLKS
jgi:hypothetical protein